MYITMFLASLLFVVLLGFALSCFGIILYLIGISLYVLFVNGIKPLRLLFLLFLTGICIFMICAIVGV